MYKPTELIFFTCLLDDQLSLYKDQHEKKNIQISHFFQEKKRSFISGLFHIFHEKIKVVVVKIL